MSTMGFTSVDDVKERLATVGYLASDAIATTVYLASELGKPLLVEGPAGVGKTELSRAVADACDASLVRLQCYEGVDEARALYEWNHAKQLLRITAGRDETWDEARNDIFSEEFLLPRPLLTAIRNDGPTVLLIDETDKADVEIEGLLLEVLGDFQITVPELGTITATTRPFVVLTSNATRELSEALRRRCLFLHIDFPEPELEESIVRLQVPGLDETLVVSVVRVVNALRALPLRKAPSIAETIDWARTLLALGADILDDDGRAGEPRRHPQARRRRGEGPQQPRPGRGPVPVMNAAADARDDLAGRLVEFVGALRTKGIPAGTSETVDAAAVMEVLGLDRRELLREGLASALVRRGGQRDVFDMTFDLYFPAGTGTSQAVLDADADMDIDDLRDLLAMALADDDSRALEQVAEIAVDMLGQVGEGGGTGGWSAYQTLERLRPQTLLVQALAARGGGQAPGQGLQSATPQVTDRLERDEVRRNIDRLPRAGGVRGAAPHRRAARPRGRHPARRPPGQRPHRLPERQPPAARGAAQHRPAAVAQAGHPARGAPPARPARPHRHPAHPARAR